MKDFFSNKLNIVLSIILVGVLGLAVYFVLAITGFSFSNKVVAIDFTNYSKAQVEQWVSENKLKDGVYTYTYEYSDDIEKDYVIYQSVKEGDVISDSLIMIYSNGQDPSGEIELPDLNVGTTEEEIEAWLNTNEFSNVTWNYETSETHEFGNVISISPSKAKKTDNVTVTVSLGANVEDISTEVPNFSTYTKEEIVRWGNRYGITLKINYETHDQAKEDEFISQSVAAGKTIKGGDSLIVTLSSGQSSGDEATIPATYLGISESDFISKLKTLGFNNLSKSSTTYYAESLEKGTIYSYDDGTFSTSRTINYALCEGKYTFDASELNGQTKTKAQSIVDSYKNRNARVNGTAISIAFETGTTSTEKSGQTYDCAISGSKITCKLYTSGATATIPEDSRYLGVSESDYLKAMKDLGYTNFTKSTTTYYSTNLKKGTIYSYDDGEIALSKSLNYALSEGAYSFVASDFNGISQDAAQNKAADLKNRNARLNGSLVSIKFTSGDSSGTKGNTYDCAVSGSVISCKVYGGSSSTTATIPSNWLGLSEANFVSKVKALGFTNVKNTGTTFYSTTLASGTIYTYDDGTFSTDKEITYGLSQGKYTFNASDYNGKTQSAVTDLVDDQRTRNANSGNLNVTFYDGTSGGTVGTTYNCTYSGTTISCALYTNGTSGSITVQNFTGQALQTLQDWADGQGLNVAVSRVYSDEVAAGYIVSQTPISGTLGKGSTISVTVSDGQDTGSLMGANALISMYSVSGDYSKAETNIRSYFVSSGFSNVNVNSIDNGKSAGVISSITINGNTLTQGTYAKSSEIVVYIASGK